MGTEEQAGPHDQGVEPGLVSARYQDLLAELTVARAFWLEVYGQAGSEETKEGASRWRDLFSGRLAFGPDPSMPTPDRLRDPALKHATKEQKANELYPVVTARYWIEALAAHLLKQLKITQGELRALRQVHEVSDGLVKARRNGTRAVARTVAAVTFILSLIPQETFDALGLGGYGWFRLAAALVAAVAIMFALLLEVSDRRILEPPESRALTQARELAPVVLTYCQALIDFDGADDSPSSEPPAPPTT